MEAVEHYVYVIRLDEAVREKAPFRKRNPQMEDDKRCFYVGETAHLPECRFEQHVHPTGTTLTCTCFDEEKPVRAKYTRYTEDHSIRLVPGRYENYNPIGPNEGESARKQARRYEDWLTRKLRRIGHGVWSNPPDFENSYWAPP